MDNQVAKAGCPSRVFGCPQFATNCNNPSVANKSKDSQLIKK